jgi:pimeloyl-ACP methyl ester carboxylesterase
MYHQKISLFIISISTIFFAQFVFAVDSEPAASPSIVTKYDYPPLHPYLATLMSVFATDSTLNLTSRHYVLIPSRSKVPFIGDRNGLDIEYKLQVGPAPVAFIVAGLGGSADSATSVLLASYYYHSGYSVITLPNPFTWFFSLSASHTGYVGYAPQDASELYDFMKKVVADLSKKKKLQATGFVVAGYSMGALESAFLQHIDREQQAFHFQNVLLINPPVDLGYGINTLDHFYDDGQRLSETRHGWLIGLVEDVATDGEISLDSLGALIKKYNIQPLDLEWLIGYTFRSTLRDVILATQQMNDRGVLKISTQFMTAREVEASTFSFADYLSQFFVPFSAPHADVAAMTLAGSLQALWAELGQDKTVLVMDNADDFLLRKGDVDKIVENFGERSVIYPLGGHVGNVWYADNRNWILAHIQPSLVFNSRK